MGTDLASRCIDHVLSSTAVLRTTSASRTAGVQPTIKLPFGRAAPVPISRARAGAPALQTHREVGTDVLLGTSVAPFGSCAAVPAGIRADRNSPSTWTLDIPAPEGPRESACPRLTPPAKLVRRERQKEACGKGSVRWSGERRF